MKHIGIDYHVVKKNYNLNYFIFSLSRVLSNMLTFSSRSLINPYSVDGFEAWVEKLSTSSLRKAIGLHYFCSLFSIGLGFVFPNGPSNLGSFLLQGCFFLHPYVFLPAPPQCNAKTKISLLFFKDSKIHKTHTTLSSSGQCNSVILRNKKFAFIFLHSGLVNPVIFWICESGNLLDW